MCERAREQRGGILHFFPFLQLSRTQDYMALFCWRASHCHCMGFNFNPLSTSVTRLLPTAIYYRQIGRFQGVSQFVLAPNVQAGYLHSYFSVPLHSQSCSYCNQVLRKEKDRARRLFQSKEAGWQRSH